MSETATSLPRRSGSPASRRGDREQLLAAKEIQLREHELELLQFESKMDELYRQMALWRDACADTLQKASKEDVTLPEIPSALLKFDRTRKKKKKEKRLSDTRASQSSDETSDEDDEVMILIEESSKTRKEKAKKAIKDISSDMISPLDDQPAKPNFVAPSLIEPLTKPPERTESDLSAQLSSPKLVNKNLLQVNTKHKKTHSVSSDEPETTSRKQDNRLNKSNPSEKAKSDNEESVDMVRTSIRAYNGYL